MGSCFVSAAEGAGAVFNWHVRPCAADYRESADVPASSGTCTACLAPSHECGLNTTVPTFVLKTVRSSAHTSSGCTFFVDDSCTKNLHSVTYHLPLLSPRRVGGASPHAAASFTDARWLAATLRPVLALAVSTVGGQPIAWQGTRGPFAKCARTASSSSLTRASLDVYSAPQEATQSC